MRGFDHTKNDANEIEVKDSRSNDLDKTDINFSNRNDSTKNKTSGDNKSHHIGNKQYFKMTQGSFILSVIQFTFCKSSLFVIF